MKQKIRPAEEEIGNVAFIFGVFGSDYDKTGALLPKAARRCNSIRTVTARTHPGSGKAGCSVLFRQKPYSEISQILLSQSGYHRSGDRCDQHDTESGVSQADSSLSCFGTGARLYRQERLEILSGRLSVQGANE